MPRKRQHTRVASPSSADAQPEEVTEDAPAKAEDACGRDHVPEDERVDPASKSANTVKEIPLPDASREDVASEGSCGPEADTESAGEDGEEKESETSLERPCKSRKTVGDSQAVSTTASCASTTPSKKGDGPAPRAGDWVSLNNDTTLCCSSCARHVRQLGEVQLVASLHLLFLESHSCVQPAGSTVSRYIVIIVSAGICPRLGDLFTSADVPT